MNYENKGNNFTNYNLTVNGSGFSVTNIFNEDSTVRSEEVRVGKEGRYSSWPRLEEKERRQRG